MARQAMICDSEDEDSDDAVSIVPIRLSPDLAQDLSLDLLNCQPLDVTCDGPSSTSSTGRLIRDVVNGDQLPAHPSPDGRRRSPSAESVLLQNAPSSFSSCSPDLHHGKYLSKNGNYRRNRPGHMSNPAEYEARTRSPPTKSFKRLDRRKAHGPKCQVKDEWEITSSEISDLDHLDASEEKHSRKVKSRNALNQLHFVPKRAKAESARVDYEQAQSEADEDSDNWQPSKVLNGVSNPFGARKTRRTGDEDLVEGLRKQKRRKTGPKLVRVEDTQEVEPAPDDRFSSTGRSVIVDLTRSALSSSQRRQYENISLPPSSAAGTVMSSPKSLAMSSSPRSSADEPVRLRQRPKKPSKKGAVDSQSIEVEADTEHHSSKIHAHDPDDDEDELAQDHPKLKAERLPANDCKSRLQSPEAEVDVEDDPGPTPLRSKKSKVTSKRKRGASPDHDGLSEESDFEPEKKPKKQKKRKAPPPAKTRRKAKQAREDANIGASGRVSGEPAPKALTHTSDEERSNALFIKVDDSPSTALTERDVNSVPPSLKPLDTDQSEPPSSRHDPKPCMPSPSVAATPSDSSSTKSSAAQSDPGHAKAKDPKVAYRVGLSKTARIPSLLRITRK